MEKNSKKDWKFNFVEEKLTDEDKDKVSVVGMEYSEEQNNLIYHIERVILASELKGEKEYVCEAIIQARSAFGRGTAKACEELLEKIEYFR